MKHSEVNFDQVAGVAVNKIIDIEVVKEFSDDRIPCATVDIITEDKVYEKVDFFWIGGLGVGAFYFYDSEKAKNYVREKMLPSLIESAFANISDDIYCAKEDGVSIEQYLENDKNASSDIAILELAGINFREIEVED